jgi:hypothetical protein
MKIKQVHLSEKDKLKAYKTAVRKAARESGLNMLTRPKVYKNKKKYSRKGKDQIIRKEIEQ